MPGGWDVMKKRILFVDDEQNILQGLKRMLRTERNEWEMAFAEGGQQALEMLEQESYDAVVSDMRMPGMDGAQLLEKVKLLHPEMVRFILSGHSDKELVMRSIGPSHQYLAKPCEPQMLKDCLNDAFALHELLSTETIRTIVTSMTSLPSLPNIYQAVVEELQSEDASIKSVGNLVEQDIGMSTKILQLVNSAYFGISRQITSPGEAANFLGIDVLKSLVLSEGVFSQFDSEALKLLSMDAMKSRSLKVANSARAICRAEKTNKVVADQAYLAGLLYEIGSLVLASNLPEEYRSVCELVQQDNIEIWQAEQQVFGTNYAQIGAYVLGLWGIDTDVVSAIAYQHRPMDIPDKKFSALTALVVACSMNSLADGDDTSAIDEGVLSYIDTVGLSDRIPVWLELCQPSEEEDAA